MDLDQSQWKSKTKSKILLFTALASLLVVATLVLSHIQSDNTIITLTGTEQHAVLHSTCATTLHPDLCISTFASAASSAITTSRDVLTTLLSQTINTLERNYLSMNQIDTVTEREKTALHDCLQLNNLSLEQLRDIQHELKSKEYSLSNHSDKLMTLLSAAQTNQETCLEGFSLDNNSNGLPNHPLVADQKHHFQLISNLLAIVKSLSGTTETTKAPWRVVEGWPEWLSAGDRRILQSTTVTPNVTVAADGSGDYTTVGAAVSAAPNRSTTRYVIRIRAGVYRENVEIPSRQTNLMFVGDGMSNTIITADRSVGLTNWTTTFNSSTVAAVGAGFLARDITFQNSAGPNGSQAVALRVGSDLSAFYRCGMLGYQDTLYVHSLRQFYTGCYIVGTVDFIFRNAASVFQNCDIQARRPNPRQRNMCTAQGRSDPNQNTGIVIQGSRIGATADLIPVQDSFPSYLGRPWREYSRTIVMQTEISNVINPAGWYPWSGDFALATLFYAEYNNTGAGANTSQTVTWPGYRVFQSDAEALPFIAGEFLAGANWLPATGFPYYLGF